MTRQWKAREDEQPTSYAWRMSQRTDCAYGAELHFLRMRQLPVQKSLFPDVDLAPVAEAFGYDAHTIRTLDDLEALAPLLSNPEGPIFLDCKINADVAAPFMSEIAAADAKAFG